VDAREGMDGVENDRVARVAMYDFDLDMAGLRRFVAYWS